MKVWAVIELADYTTVAVFATEELAEAFCERDKRIRRTLYAKWPRMAEDVMYAYEELDVLTELPPDRREAQMPP